MERITARNPEASTEQTQTRFRPISLLALLLVTLVIYGSNVYLDRIEYVAQFVQGDVETGLTWPNSRSTLFPIPRDPLQPGIPEYIETPLNPADTFIYVFIVGNLAFRVLWTAIWFGIGLWIVLWPLTHRRRTVEG